MFYSGMQSASGFDSSQGTWVVIDVPGAGWGAQVMVGGSGGEFDGRDLVFKPPTPDEAEIIRTRWASPRSAS